jgi:hypothetical protein
MRRMWMALSSTALLLAGCHDGGAGGDQPDSLTAAEKRTASAHGSWLRGQVRRADDEDWFKVAVTQAGHHEVTLASPGDNLSLDLYSSSGTRLAYSRRGGKAYEELNRRLPVGTYFVRVDAASSDVKRADYSLRIRRVADTLHVHSRRIHRHGGAVDVHGLLLNNTATWRRVSDITMIYRDAQGRELGRVSTRLHIDAPIAPRAVVPFGMVDARPPAGVHSYAFVVSSATDVASSAGNGLSLGAPTDERVPGVGRAYGGVVTNARATAARDVVVYVVRYDARGGIHDFNVAAVPALVPGASARYRVTLLGNAPNLVTRVAYAAAPAQP